MGYRGNLVRYLGYRGKLVGHRGIRWEDGLMPYIPWNTVVSLGNCGIPWKSVGYRETAYIVGYRGKSAVYNGIPWQVDGIS